MDEPGRRLVLGGTRVGAEASMPLILGGAMLLVIGVPMVGCGIVRWATSGFSTSALIDLGVMALMPVVLAAVIATALSGTRNVTRLALDRVAGQIEIRESRPLRPGKSVSETIRIQDLAGLRVRAAAPARATSVQKRQAFAGLVDRSLTISLELRFHDSLGRPARSVAFEVAGLDQKQEGADLALRLASAAGLQHQRLVGSDARSVELEFRALGAPGFEPLAATLAKADYEHDRASEDARAIAKREETPGFDPASLRSDHRVISWQPGREVRFHKPMGFATIGCFPGLALFLAGPAAFIASGGPLAGRLIAAGMAGIIGLVGGGIALLVVSSSAAHTVVFDWSERRLLEKGLFSRGSYDFTALRGIELVCRKTTGRGGGSCYCRLVAQVSESGAKPRAIDILSTDFYRYDPDTPYRMALPLATDLAQALGVPRVVTDYN